MAKQHRFYLLGVVTAAVALVICLAIFSHRGSRPNGTIPPVGSLHAFALTNGPKATSTTSWSTNLPDDPAKVRVMQQVTARVLANQSAKHTTTTTGGAGGFRDDKQAEAMRQLQQRVGASLQVYLRPENSTPLQLKGNPLAAAIAGSGDQNSRNETTAKTFLQDNAALMLLNDPDRELQLAHRQADEYGEVLRFTQQYQGLTVWPSEIGVHLDNGGNLNMVDGAYTATPENVPVKPVLVAADATIKGRQAVNGGITAQAGTPELIVYAPMDQAPKLAWKMEVSVALDQAWWVIVDALNGETLATISRVTSGSVSGSGLDLLGVNRSLNVWQSGATYYMIDASKPMFNATTGDGFIETDDAANQTQSQILSNNVLQNIYYVTSASPNSWPNPDSVSAAYNLSQTYDYYQARFGRNSYNGNGSNIFAVVRIGGLYNAFWSDIHKRMFFGNVDRFAGSLDVIGHEVTHGVIFSIGSQGGVLMYQGQSGALNEAFADIFGEMIEARTRGTNDWMLGTDLATAIRSMASPTNYNQPATMNQFVVTTSDHGGVHINSGIINRAYYLLAAGLKNPVGNQDAERIFYRSLTVSMKPFSQFIDARLGCIAAAETLFGVGSQQALKVAEAFDSVQLYAAPASAPQPSNVNAAVAAADSAMFVREHWFFTRDDLFRLETAKGDPASGTSLVTSVKVSRPSVTGNGAEMFFVGSDDSLCYLTTAGTNFSTLYSGLVHSIAISPEGRYVAFVFNTGGIPTNQIVLLDLVSNVNSTVNLVTPVSDGSPLNNISYADALSFSPDGKILIYDALSRLRGADGVVRGVWSIFGMDLPTLQQQVVIPPQDGLNIGNPSFSKTSSRFVAFDAQYTNGNSAVVTLDLFEGALGLVGTSQNGVGYPVFNGDDTRIFYAEQDLSTSSGRSVYAQNLGTDKLTTSGSRALAISDAKLAVIYRRGTYPSINTAPNLTLTNPLPNATFTAPATVLLAAAASDIDGTIAKVEFYNGDKLLFTDTTPPYGVNLLNLSAGVYTVYARATDNQGATTTTAPVRFTVIPPAQAPVMNLPGTAAGFQFSLRLPQPGLYRLEASTNLVNWTSLGSFYCITNLGYLDSSVTNFPKRFYRAVSVP